MKYYLRNSYNHSLQIRNTYTRMVSYIRKWNLKHTDKPILRVEIKPIGIVEYPKLKWYRRIINYIIGRV